MENVTVECPHCCKKGEIIRPSARQVAYGECPSCKKFVLVIESFVAPLDKKIMTKGTKAQKIQHLLDIVVELFGPIFGEMVFQGLTSMKVAGQDWGRRKLFPIPEVAPSISDPEAPKITLSDVRELILDSNLVGTEGHEGFFEQWLGIQKKDQ